jgi:hypothetical protein
MARRGSDNTAIIILIIFCVVCSMSSVFGGAGIYLSLEKRKGDPCEGDDENAEYALDKDLKCRFTECNTGYELDEKGMCALIGRRKPGDICQGRDDNAVYEVGEDLNCDFIQCMAGYSFNDEKRICEVDEAGEAGLVVGCKKFRIKGRYLYYLKDMGDGNLRTDKRTVSGTEGWEFEGSFPNNLRIKGPKGYYLKDMNIDNKVRFDNRSTVPGVGGWSIEGLKMNDVRIKSRYGRYLAMNTDGALYMHISKIPDANAWKIVC